MTTTNPPLVKLAGMYENRSARTGDTYFVGYLGAVKVLVVRDKKAEAGQPGWSLLMAQRPERPERKEPAA